MLIFYFMIIQGFYSSDELASCLFIFPPSDFSHSAPVQMMHSLHIVLLVSSGF